MEKNEYSFVTSLREAAPRSKRKQGLGLGSGCGTAINISVTNTGTESDCDGHSHNNKPVLDAQSMDDDGYLYLRHKSDGLEESVTEKVKAGYSDKANHATEADNANMWNKRQFDDYLDQPVRKTDSVQHEEVITDTLRGAGQFEDGLLGSGYRLWQDANGLIHLTIDKLTVRQTMVVLELLVERIRSVGGQIVVSAANGKIKAVEDTGEAYRITFEGDNYFVAHDLMRCQVFNGVTNADGIQSPIRGYWVEVLTVEGNSILVQKTEFEEYKTEPLAGDECVLMGNTENELRQNFISISATEDGQPRIDVMNGVKSKSFECCLRARLGNLDGIRDSRFPANNQPHGNGLYCDNAYLQGTFLLMTGEDILTKFEVTEGKINSAVEGLRDDIVMGKGYLANASFSRGLEKWHTSAATTFFTSGAQWIWANGSVLSNHGTGTIVCYDGMRKVLRIRNSFIVQKNTDMQNITDFKPEKNEKRELRPVYLSFFYRCTSPGVLKVEFTNRGPMESPQPVQLSVDERIDVTDGYRQFSCNGMWNGSGDFRLSFTGEMYIYLPVLSTDPADSLSYKYRTLFEQSDRLVKISAAVFDKDGAALKETGLFIKAEGSGLYAQDANGNSALIGVCINEKDEHGNIVSKIKLTADHILLEGLVTANGNFRILADGSVEAKNGRFSGEVTAHRGQFLGAIGAPYIAPGEDSSSLMFPSVDTGMNIMITGDASAKKGVLLPLYHEIDGVEVDIMNASGVATFISFPIAHDVANDQDPQLYYRNQRVSFIRLSGGCARCRLKAFVHPSTAGNYVSYTVLNTADFDMVQEGVNRIIQTTITI